MGLSTNLGMISMLLVSICMCSPSAGKEILGTFSIHSMQLSPQSPKIRGNLDTNFPQCWLLWSLALRPPGAESGENRPGGLSTGSGRDERRERLVLSVLWQAT